MIWWLVADFEAAGLLAEDGADSLKSGRRLGLVLGGTAPSHLLPRCTPAAT